MDTLSSMAASVIHYEEPSKFPGIDIDLSLVIGADQTYSTLSAAWQNVTPLLKTLRLSIPTTASSRASRCALRSPRIEKTLAKNEVQSYVDTIIENLAKIGVVLR